MTTQTTRDVLVKARALIAKGWTQRALARDARGEIVSPGVDGACAWCVVGALAAASSDSYLPAAEAMMDILAVAGHGSIPRWNDVPERTQADVLDAFDRTISAQGGT